jgi:hypothetical protein
VLPFTKNEFNKSIKDAFLGLCELELTGWDYSPKLSITDPISEVKRICFNPDVKYEQVFLAIHRFGAYNIQIIDGSILQFWLSSDKKRARYAYYPCPFEKIDQGLLDSISSGDLERSVLEEQLYSELDVHITKPVIRYDFDEIAYNPVYHPASHLTVGIHTNSRWPIKGFLTPEAFSLYIAKQYYDLHWAHSCEEEKCQLGYKSKFDRRIKDILAVTRRQDLALFDESEEAQLYLY